MALPSEGLAKLTEYLNQVRRQSEHAIDVLNTRIAELEKENHVLKHEFEKADEERTHFKLSAERLKLENNTKWKLHERDDWRALVENLQADRKRVQDEYKILEEQYIELSDQMAAVKGLPISSPDVLITSENSDNNRENIVNIRESSVLSDLGRRLGVPGVATSVNSSTPPVSPAKEHPASCNATPSAASAVKRELNEALNQIQHLEQIHAVEKRALQDEINRLKEDIHHLRYHELHGLKPPAANIPIISQYKQPEEGITSMSEGIAATSYNTSTEGVFESQERPNSSWSIWGLFGFSSEPPVKTKVTIIHV